MKLSAGARSKQTSAKSKQTRRYVTRALPQLPNHREVDGPRPPDMPDNATSVVFHVNDPIILPFRDCLQSANEIRMKFGQEVKQRNHKFRNYSMKDGNFYKPVIFSSQVQSKLLCEKSQQFCKRFFLVSHPVQRFVTLFELCKKSKGAMKICQKEGYHPNMTLYEFAQVQDGVLFRYLLAQTNKCRNSSKLEICQMFPSKMQRLSNATYLRYLRLVLRHINGFKGVGLMMNPQITSLLFQKFLSLNLTGCNNWSTKVPRMGNITLKLLLNEASLLKFFKADLVIYKTFEQIYSTQRQKLLNNITAGGSMSLKPFSHFHDQKKVPRTSTMKPTSRSTSLLVGKLVRHKAGFASKALK
jgi:hypothetical protein